MTGVCALALLLSPLAGAAAPAPQVSLTARAYKPGEIVLVSVSREDPSVPPRGRFGGQALSFFPAARRGRFLAFAGIDVAASTGTRRLVVELQAPDGRRREVRRLVRVTYKKFATRRLTVDANFVTPKPEDERRADREADLLAKLFSTVTPRLYFSGSFHSPIPGAVSSRFGERSVFNGVPKAPHSGADLRAALGTPVHAPAGGRVVLAQNLFYPGNVVILDHGYGLFSLYAHLSKIDVKVGQVVGPGELLGLVGATGRVTGPHLHWAVKVGNAAHVDPFSLTALDLDAWLKPKARRSAPGAISYNDARVEKHPEAARR